MFSKNRGWLNQQSSKPKNFHSLEHLKYLYQVLVKNHAVTDNNRSLLVETLRSISEILIWGDQNDSSVFDFFLEKNMLLFFLKILRQKSGRYITVQLLQTLNILFENIRNETSLYFLLSNNHINSIIVHKFDFSDEEVLAYYISFLKTLSLKLNSHTIHFFYNEHTNDFALYTEAIKFFNHPESMVRIAVRTLTLNVCKVNDKTMLTYITNRTAAPYFSNLVWFIGNNVLEINNCIRSDQNHQNRGTLSTLVAEHLDHMHYLNDFLRLDIQALNRVLTQHLLNRLFLPLYVHSLTNHQANHHTAEKPSVSSVLSLFLLSQVFLIFDHPPLINSLAEFILYGDLDAMLQQTQDTAGQEGEAWRFVAPSQSLEQSLEQNRLSALECEKMEAAAAATAAATATAATPRPGLDWTHSEGAYSAVSASQDFANTTDEEKEKIKAAAVAHITQSSTSMENRPYFATILNSLNCQENDYKALFGLCLLWAMGSNQGIRPDLLEKCGITAKSESKWLYNTVMVDHLLALLKQSTQYSGRIRPVALKVAVLLLKQLALKDGRCFLQDHHLAAILGAQEDSMTLLRNFYKRDELFLDMFEDEYRIMKVQPLNVEYLTMDSSILLPPTGTPLTGIDFDKRLPSGELERIRWAIKGFFCIRDICLALRNESETRLPLINDSELVKMADKLDLNNSDLIACTVVMKGKSQKLRRFLVIYPTQLILVEPDSKRLGWGVVCFVGPLQDLEVMGDKEDSRSLHLTIHRRASSAHGKPQPLLAARLIFDDHIRCMAAKQRLSKGCRKARQRKTQSIGALLEISINTTAAPAPSQADSGLGYAAAATASSSHHSQPPISERVAGHHPLQGADEGASSGKFIASPTGEESKAALSGHPTMIPLGSNAGRDSPSARPDTAGVARPLHLTTGSLQQSTTGPPSPSPGDIPTPASQEAIHSLNPLPAAAVSRDRPELTFHELAVLGSRSPLGGDSAHPTGPAPAAAQKVGVADLLPEALAVQDNRPSVVSEGTKILVPPNQLDSLADDNKQTETPTPTTTTPAAPLSQQSNSKLAGFQGTEVAPLKMEASIQEESRLRSEPSLEHSG